MLHRPRTAVTVAAVAAPVGAYALLYAPGSAGDSAPRGTGRYAEHFSISNMWNRTVDSSISWLIRRARVQGNEVEEEEED